MTKPVRRDKDVINSSVITGLRMEPALAAKLCEFALQYGTTIGLKRGDVAGATRYLLRLGLGQAADNAAMAGLGGAGRGRAREAGVLAGIRLDPDIVDGLRGTPRGHSGQLAGVGDLLNAAGSARHLLRLGLGWSQEESLNAEDRFQQIANARKALVKR